MAQGKQKSRSKQSRRRLGRGLTSLLTAPVEIEAKDGGDVESVAAQALEQGPSRPPVEPTPGPKPEAEPDGEVDRTTVQLLALKDIHPRPGQPRQDFDEAALSQLAASIRSAGLMQPILVRPDGAGGYEIIAGERRWRAAGSIDLQSIPAIVRELDDEACAEWSLIENLQREDLNPIERAEAFRRLIDEFDLSHQDLARRVGLDRSNISNHLRLNELDDECKAALREGRLSMGHAKALLSITNITQRQALARRAIREQWSVRRVEREARRVGGERDSSGANGGFAPASPHIEDLQRRLGEHLGTKVRVVPGRKKGAGRLVIEFFNLDHFENIMQTLQFPLDT